MDYCWKCGSPMTKNSRERVCSSCGRTVQRHKNNTLAYDDTSSSSSGGVLGAFLCLGLFGLAIASAKKNHSTDDMDIPSMDEDSVTFTQGDDVQMQDNESIRLKELEYNERQEKRDTKIGLICGLGIPLLIILAIFLGFGINKVMAQAQGKISAGHHEDYIGENYEAVVKQFEEMGFKNIVTIDLDDSGLAFWNDGKVKSVSIEGNDSFEELSYFYPDAKVIIKYH